MSETEQERRRIALLLIAKVEELRAKFDLLRRDENRQYAADQALGAAGEITLLLHHEFKIWDFEQFKRERTCERCDRSPISSETVCDVCKTEDGGLRC